MMVTDQSFWNDVLIWFLGLVGTIITSILIPYITKLLKSKTDNTNLQYVITELSQTVQTSIDYVNQTFVEQLKIDGKFDAENQAKALKLATENVMNNLTTKTIQVLGKDGIDIENLIISYIEAKISESKK